MNKLIAFLAILLVLIAGLFVLITKMENQTDLYTDVQKVTTVDQGTTGDYFVYFSKETCTHCEDVKNDVEKFIPELDENAPDVGFYLVDMDDPANNDKYFATPSNGDELVPGTDYYYDPSQVPAGYNLDDFRIAGTPTLIYVSDGVITDIAIGASQEKTEETPMGVVELLEKKAKDLGFEFDASFNG